MKKIPSLFKRDYDGTRLLYNELVPGTEWVQAGEGVATVKLDGTSCLVRAGVLYKRYELKKGKSAPAGFEAADLDPITGDQPGWIPVREGDPASRWHLEAWVARTLREDGTYELVGPKVQGNPYQHKSHVLIRHGKALFEPDPPRTFDALKEWFAANVVEGIVWWRAVNDPNCDKVKIKRRDFGFDWPPLKE